jgi:hypothetical protein
LTYFEKRKKKEDNTNRFSKNDDPPLLSYVGKMIFKHFFSYCFLFLRGRERERNCWTLDVDDPQRSVTLLDLSLIDLTAERETCGPHGTFVDT